MSADHVASLLERLGMLTRAELRRSASAHGLRAAQLDALRYLARANRYSDTLIATADYLGTTKGTTSQTLRALESKGLIERLADADDKRVAHCRVTRAGRRVALATSPPPLLRAAVEELTVDLDADLESLLRTLQRQNGGKSFGICHTCEHFEAKGGRFRCGLTQERLTRDDSQKLCREHLHVVG